MIRELLKWKVAAFWPYTPLLGDSVELGQHLKNVTPWINAAVPGSIYADLINAKMIDDPYFEQNSLKCEWVSNRWWAYKTTFEYEETIADDEQVELVFEGIDYKAHIYVNNKNVAVHEGMFIPVILNITGQLKKDKKCSVRVLFENSPDEMSQIGYTSKTKILKSRFNYKWDFCTRLVNVGLYSKVYLRKIKKLVLRDYHFKAYKPLEQSNTSVEFNIEAIVNCKAKINIELQNGSEIYTASSELLEISVGMNKVNIDVNIQNIKLWYPNGLGEQPLYDLKAFAETETEKIDVLTARVGFCQKEFVKNENSSEDSLNYTFVINGRKTYIKGVNLTPLDLMYGCVDYKRYDKLLKQLRDANVNLVRVWGGGVIETEAFYSLCDQYGIMVWQEFIQSSSGIENVPSKNENFLKELSAAAENAVKIKRNNVSLAVWSGGNELTDEAGIPSTFDDENIKMLKTIVEKYDNGRYMLPTSASGPLSFTNCDEPSRNHDVHGPWKFLGEEEHYQFYNNIDSLFNSEFGCDGVSSIETIKEIMSKENQYAANMNDNYDWRHHGEWWDTYFRDSEIFGEISDLTEFYKLSQFIQAEALRYAIEANRRRAFENSGSIIWQGNEPYPNVSCTSLIDYFLRPKLALFTVKNAFCAVQATLKYDSFILNKNSELTAEVFISNDFEEGTINVSCLLIDDKGQTVHNDEFNGSAGFGKAVFAGRIAFIPAEGTKSILAKLTTKSGGKTFHNSVLFLVKDENGLCNKQAVCAYYDEIYGGDGE